MDDGPVVEVKGGKLRGFVAENHDGGTYLAFYGIPFAEPPIGNLRFKEPQSPKSWNGIRDAIKEAPKSMQYDMLLHQQTGDEDCLYLNVSTTALTGKKAVMVWIHGGAFVLGGPHIAQYGPDYLIQHDIVYVSIVYRLGCLGFLNLGLPEASGNQGLKDQVAALQWVKENIHVFGGDPQNVTIFGESAGGASVHYLTLSPLAKGLFHKAIVQSGVSTNPWAFERDPKADAMRLIECLGKKVKDYKGALEVLMNTSATAIIEAQKRMDIGNVDFELTCIFVPTVDGGSPKPFAAAPPSEMMKKGVDVPLLIGYTSDEGILFLTGPNIDEHLRKAKADFTNVLARDLKFLPITDVEKISETVKQFYFGKEKLTPEMEKQKWNKYKGDVQFINGIQEATDLQMNKSTPTYFYRFSYRANYPTFQTLVKSNIEGTCHGDDIGALFYCPLFGRTEVLEKGTRDRLTMQRMTRMWTSFAKTGDPTPKVDEEITCKWEPMKVGEKKYLEINDNLVAGKNPDAASWNFWKKVLKGLK